MIIRQVAHIIADYVVFLELTDEENLNLDTAVEASEYLGYQLENLDKGFLRELVDAFAVIADEYSGEAQKIVRNIAHSFDLEEALAADDPARLAELEALRDARDLNAGIPSLERCESRATPMSTLSRQRQRIPNL